MSNLIVTTPFLRFHLKLYLKTRLDASELTFEFESRDIYEAADKVVAVGLALDKCPSIVTWRILTCSQVIEEAV